MVSHHPASTPAHNADPTHQDLPLIAAALALSAVVTFAVLIAQKLA